MILIEEEIINGQICKYYHGIDFESIKSHPKDGTGGFIVFLVESFMGEIRNHNRDRKLKSLLQNKEFIPVDTDEMIHDFVGIYQYEGVGLESILSIVKKKIKEYNFNFSYLSSENNRNGNEFH